jgi:hypothetical protein
MYELGPLILYISGRVHGQEIMAAAE